MSLLEIDIIQHTAQFAAKNGKKFLDALGEREKSNPQFEFLKAASPNYKYFMALVDGYCKVIALRASEVEKLTQI